MVNKPGFLTTKPKKSVCGKCPLYKPKSTRRNNSWLIPTTYWPDEDGEVKLMIVGESPNLADDKSNESMLGDTGKLVRLMVRRILKKRLMLDSLPGLEGIGLSTVVRCKSDKKNALDDEGQVNCGGYLDKDIKKLKPNVVVLMGNAAVRYYFPHERGITSARGATHEKDGTIYLLTYHPAYILRDATGKEKWKEMTGNQKDWANDIERALEHSGILPRKVTSIETRIEVEDEFSSRRLKSIDGLVKPVYIDTVEKFKRLAKKMYNLPKGSVLCTDTETNNLNRVFSNDMLSVQYGWDGKVGYVLPYKHKKSPFNSDDLAKLSRINNRLMTKPTKNEILWCFANAKFDLHQYRREFECELLSSPNVDVAQVAHLLNENRLKGARDPECYYQGQKGLSLAVLSEVYLGVQLSSEDKKDRANIRRWPMKRFVPYAAGDVVWPWLILKEQLREAEEDNYRRPLLRLIKYLLSPANLLCVEMENNGFPIDLAHTQLIRGRNSPLIAEKKRLMTVLSKMKWAKKANKVIVGKVARGNSFLFGEAPFYLNPSKDRHRRLLFYDVMKYKPLSFTEKEQPKVDSEFYEEYGIWDEDTNEPMNEAAAVSDWVGVDKMMSSFVKNFWKLVDPDRGHPDMCPDGRVRPQVRLAATTSGRPAVSKPALQQLPRATDAWRKAVKDMFTIEECNVLIMADLKANEVRWAAINAQAKKLGRLFWDGLKATKRFRKFVNKFKGDDKVRYKRVLVLQETAKWDGDKPTNDAAKKVRGMCKKYPKIKKALFLEEDASLRADIHKQTASAFYGVPIKKVSKSLRQDTKAVIFGHIAARGPKAIAAQIGKTKDETIRLLREFDKRFPDLANRLKDNAHQAEHRGYVEGPQGRRRRFSSAIWEDPEEWVHAKARRQARNNTIQGIASDACLIAAFCLLDYIRKNNKSWKIMNIVHDAVYIEAPIDEMKEALWAIEMCLTEWTMAWMTKHFGINFAAPLESDIEVGLTMGTYYGWNGTDPHIEILDKKIRADHEKKYGNGGSEEFAA